MKIFIVTSANAEWSGIKFSFPVVQMASYPYGEYFQTTVASALQYIFDRFTPDLVINLGTCGGFAGVVNHGDVILMEQTFIYDIAELMNSADVTDYYASSLDLSWLAEPHPYPTRREINCRGG